MHEVFDSAKYFVGFNRFLSYMEVKCQIRLERYSKVFCVFGTNKTCGAKFVLDHWVTLPKFIAKHLELLNGIFHVLAYSYTALMFS